MPKQVPEKFKDFYYETQDSVSTEFSTESKGELDLERFLDGQPACWKVSGFQRSFALKTLVLSNPLLIFKDHIKLYEKILTHGFRVFVWSDSKCIECKEVGEILSAVAKIIPTTEETVNEAFLEISKCSADQFMQLNYLDFERMKNKLYALVGIESTSKHDNELSIDFEQLLNVPDKIFRPLLNSIKHKKITCLTIPCKNDSEKASELIHFIIENFQDIRTLDLSFTGLSLLLPFFDKNTSLFPLLETFKINNDNSKYELEENKYKNFALLFDKIITKRALKCLAVPYILLTDKQLEFIQTIKTLETFDILYSFKSITNFFQKKYYPWKHFSITNYEEDGDGITYLHDPSCFPLMEQLTLNTNQTNIQIPPISNHEHKAYPLKELHLLNANLSFETFLNILKYYPDLEYLYLNNTNFIEIPDVIQFPIMKKLRKLKIIECSSISALLIAHLLNASPFLENLKISDTEIIETGLSPDLFKNKNTRLRVLNMNKLKPSESFILFLLKKYCNIERLLLNDVQPTSLDEDEANDIKLPMLHFFKVVKTTLTLETIKMILSSTSALLHFNCRDRSPFERDDMLSSILNQKKQLRSLTLDNATSSDFELTSLEEIDIHNYEEYPEGLPKFLQLCSNLKYLKLENTKDNSNEKNSEEKYDLSSSSLIQASILTTEKIDEIYTALSTTNHLVSLKINDKFLELLSLKKFASIFNKLRDLSIEDESDRTIFNFFTETKFPLLVTLSVICPNLDKKTIELILKQCPQLAHLNIFESTEMDCVFIQHLEKKYPFVYITSKHSSNKLAGRQLITSMLKKLASTTYPDSNSQTSKTIFLPQQNKGKSLTLCTEEKKTDEIYTYYFLENIPAERTICGTTHFNLYTFNFEDFEFDETISEEIKYEFSKKSFNELKKDFHNRNDVVFSYPITITLDSKQYFVLPMTNLSDQIAFDDKEHLCVSSNHPIKIYRCPDCYIIRLKEESSAVELVVHYVLYTGGYHEKNKLTHQHAPILNQLFNNNELAKPFQMNHLFSMDLTDDAPLSVQIKPNSDGYLTIESEAFTLSQLAQFLHSFKPGKLSQPDAKGLDFINCLLRDRIGSCAHRAVAFAAIMQILGLEDVCRLYQVKTWAGKSIHLGVTVYDQTLGRWINIELGGYKMNLVVKIPPTRSFSPPLECKPIDRSSIFRQTISFEDKTLNTFESFLNEAQKITPTLRNILIKNCNNDQAFQIYAGFLQHRRCYFINNLKNVNKNTTIIKKDGELAKIDSPLVKFLNLAKAGDVLLVAFDEKLPQYNSLIDSQGRQLDKDTVVPEGVIVIGLITKEAEPFFREDFLSRFSAQCDINKLLSSPVAMPYELSIEEAPKDAIDLTGESDPLSILNKSISVDDKNCFHAEKGLLVQLCDNSKEEKKATTVALINPELTDYTKMFLIQACMAKEVEFNGDILSFPSHVSVKCFRQDFCYDLPAESSLEKLNKQSWQFALNLVTFDYFFKFQKFSKEGFRRLPGLLQQSQNKECVVLMTNSIPFDKWARFLKEARKHQVKLRLVLANNVDFPSEMKCVEPSELKLEESKQTTSNRISVIVTNDPDKAIDDIISKQKKTCRVLNVHENLGFNSIFFEIKAESTKKSFEFIPGTLLKELSEGRTIILKGHLSVDLASQLETLFATKPILFINGQAFSVNKGKLIIVTSDEKIFSFARPEQGWPLHKVAEEKSSETKPTPTTKYIDYARDLKATFSKAPIVRIKGDVAILRLWVNRKNLENILERKVSIHCGADHCEAWLNAPKDTMNVLIIDDSDPKRFDNLYDVCNHWTKRSVLLRGQILPLPENCFIISLESPTHQQNDLIKINAPTLFLQNESIQELAQRLITPVLMQYSDMDEKTRHEITHIFLNSGQQKIELTELNLKAMLSYFQYFAARKKVSESKSVPWIDFAKSAVGLEMRYTLKDDEWGLPQHLLPRVYVESKKFVMTNFSLLAMQTLKIMLLSQSHNGKYIFILEGGSGIGKSTMAEELLISMKMPYEVLTVGQPEAMRERLMIALREGKKVIINEINTPQVVPVITKFLIDLQATCSRTADFAIIGTQNPVSFRSRELFPDALAQNFAWIKLEDFSREQLCYIVRLANHCKEEEARDLVNQYFKDQAKLTDKLTPRDLFRAAEKYIKKPEQKPTPMDLVKLNEKRKADKEHDEAPAAKRQHLISASKNGFFAAQSDSLGLGGTSESGLSKQQHF